MGDEAGRWLDDVAKSQQPMHQLAGRLRKHLSADQTHRVLELVELRRRGEEKFTMAGKMFFTRTALEQATDQWIASYKAERFANRGQVADLCCGVGGDTLGLVGKVRGLMLCDRSPTMTLFARHNLAIADHSQQTSIGVSNQDAKLIALSEYDAWHIDPDRRPAGKRTTDAAFHDPSDTDIDTLLAANPHAAIKLAPGCEPPTRWTDDGELEWVSRGGECKQLVVWRGNLATTPGRRRATLVEPDGDKCNVVGAVTGSGGDPVEMNPQIDRYVFEPDPAVLASDLVGALAAAHGWWRFGKSDGYLTGAENTDEPACATFEVDEVMPLRIKKLASYLRERGIGRLEIKHRAVELAPQRLRSELKLKGDRAATLLVTTAGERQIAIVAKRLPTACNQIQSY